MCVHSEDSVATLTMVSQNKCDMTSSVTFYNVTYIHSVTAIQPKPKLKEFAYGYQLITGPISNLL